VIEILVFCLLILCMYFRKRFLACPSSLMSVVSEDAHKHELQNLEAEHQKDIQGLVRQEI
jgi:hypothetical protein